MLLSQKDDSIKLYKDAYTNIKLFEVWKDTYEKKFCGDVVFNEDTVAYKIGVKPRRKKDLEELKQVKGIIDDFEEILRHNNVSDKENAFNRLIALFICKIVDESQKSDNDEVEFQYKVGTDTYETLQDRLQRLHRDGMKNFMKEKVMYVSDDYIENLLQQYTDSHKREHLIADLKQQIRILKFYTNNDFSFIDVHNEDLFYKNGKILVEVIQLFEKYKIIGAKNLQLLGDLFEELLDRGFKQNQGQFFTPMPITRFIWDSLPLHKIITSAKQLPKIIDYACGAGHFLTQGFEAVNNFVNRNFNVNLKSDWVREKIYGIEKDYRLARVSKVSLFMHGAGESRVIFSDGLDNNKGSNKEIEPNSFDILTANPPYSVAAFKQYLNLKNESDFAVLPEIKLTGSEIETLFVERVSQLLKPCGLAAVILKSTVLNTNNPHSYIVARESILKNFFIRAIVLLRGETFAATETETVVMFLEKFKGPPKRFELVKDSVNCILNKDSDNIEGFEDKKIFKAWLEKINVDELTYKKFFKHQWNFTDWSNVYYFKQYYKEFFNSKKYLDKTGTEKFKNLSKDQQTNWINQNFYDFVYDIEYEKLNYFACVYNQTTLIVTAPDDKKTQKNFLGYRWIGKRRQKGIDVFKPGGLLYDDKNRDAEDTISALIRGNFDNHRQVIDDKFKEYCYYLRLQDMIDFTGVTFNKSIKINRQREKKSNFGTLYKLSDENIFDVSIGDRVLSSDVIENGSYPVYSANVFKPFGRIDKLNLDDFSRPSIIWGIDGDWMVNLIEANKPFYPTDHCGVLRIKTDEILPKYFMIALRIEGEMENFSRSNRSAIERIKNLAISIPSFDIQQEVVNKINDIEDKIKIAEKLIEKFNSDIKNKFDEMFSGMKEKIKIGDCCIIEKGDNLTREQAIAGEVPVIAGGVSPSCYHNVANRPANVITISASDNAGYVNFWRVPIFATDCNTLTNKNNFAIEFIYYALKNQQDKIYELQKGANQKHVYAEDIAKIEIPNALSDEQNKFSQYVQNMENAKHNTTNEIEKLLVQREEIISKYFK